MLKWIWTLIDKKEPAAVGAVITAALGLAVAFGWKLTPGQVGSITSILVLGYGLWTRQTVWSDNTHQEQVAKALKLGAAGAGGAAGAAAGGATGAATGEVVESVSRGIGDLIDGILRRGKNQ